MAKERSAKKKKDTTSAPVPVPVPVPVSVPAAAGGGSAEAVAAAAAPYNGADNPWARWPHPRPDSYYTGPYSTYDWSHAAWPSHGDFGAYPPPPPPPRAGYPFVNPMQQPMPPGGTGNSPNSSNPDSQSDDGSSFSDAAGEDPTGENKQNRKRTKSSVIKSGKGKQQQQQQQQQHPDENTAKNKRYGMEEVKDLVRFRTDLQSKFETMSTHLELWTSIGERMSDRGHPRRQWESYRDKWDIELRRYQKELKTLQAGLTETKDGESMEQQQQQMVFTDELLQEIHTRLTSRPKAALRSRFQSGAGGARGCLGEESAREVAGKRMKKSVNNQLLVDSIVEKVVEKVGCFDDTASAQGFKEVLDAVVNLTNVLLADVNSAAAAAAAAQQGGFSTEFEIDDKVFTWLKSIGKEQYASHFAASHVDWTNLVLLDRDDLAEMKIPVGPRKFLLRELDKLRPPPTGVAAAAAAAEEQELLNLQTQLQQEATDSEVV